MVSLITIASVLAFAGGGIGYFSFHTSLNMILRTFVNLKESGMVYPLYKEPPISSISKYWIYELKNPRNFLLGQRMKLKLRGPYIYTAYLYRTNVVFSDREKLIAYHTNRKLYLNEDASENLDEKFWVVNPVYVGMQKAVKDIVIDKLPFKRISEPIVFNSVNIFAELYKERLTTKKSARELLEGTKIELLETLTALADRFGVKALLPPGPPENTFGISHAQNHTIDVQEIWTGVGDPDHLAKVHLWRGKPKVEYWTGKCSIINGTNGELYKPFIKAGEPIKVFLGQLCRTFYLEPIGDKPIEVGNGIMALEFEISKRIYMGARSEPNNKCFCKDTRTYDCQYDGLLSIGPCYFDAPLFFGRANLEGAGRQIRSLLDEGSLDNPMIPNKQSFYLEPITGTILKLNLSLTGTFKIVRQKYMRDLDRVQNITYAPLFIANETAVVPFRISWPLKLLQKVYDYHKPGMLLIAASGGIILLFGARMGRKRKTQPAEITVSAQLEQNNQPEANP